MCCFIKLNRIKVARERFALFSPVFLLDKADIDERDMLEFAFTLIRAVPFCTR